LPILESISCGTPVLASDIPVHREVAGPCAKYFHLHQDTIANTIQSALTDGATIVELSSNCSSTSARYSWQNSTNELLSLFSTVLS